MGHITQILGLSNDIVNIYNGDELKRMNDRLIMSETYIHFLKNELSCTKLEYRRTSENRINSLSDELKCVRKKLNREESKCKSLMDEIEHNNKQYNIYKNLVLEEKKALISLHDTSVKKLKKELENTKLNLNRSEA